MSLETENERNFDLDLLLQNDNGRKLFGQFLKEFKNSSDNLLTLYLICCCFQNHKRLDDRHRIRQILEKTYHSCFIKNQLPHLSADLKNKISESLKKATYNESVFNAVKLELKNILEHEYFPKFLQSKLFNQSEFNLFYDEAQEENEQLLRLKKNLSNKKLCDDNISYRSVTSINSMAKQHQNRNHIKQQQQQQMSMNKSEMLDISNMKFDDLEINKKGNKKTKTPLSQTNPKMFFDMLNTRLEQYVEGQNAPLPKQPHSVSTGNLQHNQQLHKDSHREALALETNQSKDYNSHYSALNNTRGHVANLNNSNMSAHRIGHMNHSLVDAHARTDKKSQHHFYKLTSKSKEVDIDDQNHKRNVMSLSKNDVVSYETNELKRDLKQSYDSGVSSMRSASSIDRVNDWLSSSTSHPTATTISTAQPSIDEIKAMNKKMQQQAVNSKTTVAYFLPGEDLPYISTFNGNSLTLAQFKQLITKKGKFRYFFKTKSDLLDEECVVFEEVTDENNIVPKFNEKIIAKIEKIG